MKTTSNISGSWFPTGFYGHDRMRKREEFLIEYRQLAKPQPPQKFILRSSQPSSAHVFSHHDNKNAILKDVSLFGQGFGKKKQPANAEMYKSDTVKSFCRDKSTMGYPLISTYRQSFKMDGPTVQTLITPLPSTDRPYTTMYRLTHGTDSLNHHFINAMSNETLMLNIQNRQHQAKMKVIDSRETVAACMSWYKPKLPPVSSNPNCNYVEMQPAHVSAINCNNCLNTGDRAAVLEPSHEEQNV